MEKIINSISNGNKIIENTKANILNQNEKYQEKYDSIKIMSVLRDKDDENSTRLKNIVDNSNSHIEYLNFIQNELESITNFVENDSIPDLNHGCLYFGNGTLFYSSELLNNSEKEIFEIILNHIICYTGCLYIISSANVRLSYLTTAISVCYNEPVNFNDGKNIYNNKKDKFNHIVFDISDNYKNFIIRNRKMMNFFKIPQDDYARKSGYNIIYRIVIGKKIRLENMYINIGNDSEISSIRKASNLNIDSFKLA